MMTYDNTTLVSREISDKKHRATDCKTSSYFCGVFLEIPIIASPMPDVCNGIMAAELAKLGAMGIIHRFQSIEEQVTQFNIALIHSGRSVGSRILQPIGCAIGITEDYLERFQALYDSGCRIFCLDTANGANLLVKEAVSNIEQIRSQGDFYLIAGNVATKEGYRFLWDMGIDAVRVGIAGGSVCETKTETGIHIPTLHSVVEITSWKQQLSEDFLNTVPEPPLVIADGGIRTPGDMNKALAAGADAIMCGNIFAGTEESPGEVFKFEGKLKKLYRGAASYSVQQENGKEPAYNEGNETLVSYKGPVKKIFERFKEGLQSAMSYGNASNLTEFANNVELKLL